MIDIRCGNALEILPTLRAKSVQCVVTSPPYWGLRDYGLPPFVWGGDGDCRHQWSEHLQPAANGIINGRMKGRTLSARSATRQPKRSKFCRRCGAWSGQLGLEPTPQLYVEHLVAIFDEVRRVLADDSVVWLNLGDSYASGKGTCFNPGGGKTSLGSVTNPGKNGKAAGCYPLDRGNKSTLAASGLKPKDLVGIPWMVAFALRDAGWFLRSDIIWHKPNPMPESVRDRPTKAHEYLFLFSTSPRYYYDIDAIRTPHAAESIARMGRGRSNAHKYHDGGPGGQTLATDLSHGCHPNGSNRRSVWTLPPEPFRGAHFATFPRRLVEPCILAGSRRGDLVLDPFAGVCTVGIVCKEQGRRFLGIDLSPSYCRMGRRRLEHAA